jgi:hypothetical protein
MFTEVPWPSAPTTGQLGRCRPAAPPQPTSRESLQVSCPRSFARTAGWLRPACKEHIQMSGRMHVGSGSGLHMLLSCLQVLQGDAIGSRAYSMLPCLAAGYILLYIIHELCAAQPPIQVSDSALHPAQASVLTHPPPHSNGPLQHWQAH